MRDLKDRLHNHVIVCGYGSKGRAIVDELLAHGHDPEDIVIIDNSEVACAAATRRKLVVLRGDASEEEILRAAGVERAGYVLVGPDRDDAATLICLTVRNLNAAVNIVASARQEVNIKLLYGAGADLVVAPAVTGGRLMAAAVRQQAVPRFLEDMMMFGKGLSVTEHIVTSTEAGQTISAIAELGTMQLLGMMRQDERIPFNVSASEPLQAGDILVLLIDELVSNPPPDAP